MCRSCGVMEGLLRCKDCFGQHLLCRNCIITSHNLLPFHRLERWDGCCFQSTSLFDQGFILNLGHGGGQCPLNESYTGAWQDFPDDGSPVDEPNIMEDDGRSFDVLVLTDIAGIFTHRVSWCRCNGPPEKPMELFRQQIFPASFNRVKSGFTFRVLDHFYMDVMECKTAATSFFQKLQRLTNNCFPKKVHVSAQSVYYSICSFNIMAEPIPRAYACVAPVA